MLKVLGSNPAAVYCLLGLCATGVLQPAYKLRANWRHKWQPRGQRQTRDFNQHFNQHMPQCYEIQILLLIN